MYKRERIEVNNIFASNIFIFRYIFVTLLAILIGCQPSAKKGEGYLSIKSIAKTKYNGPIHYLENKDSSYTICYSQKKKTVLVPNPPLSFFVYDNQTGEIVFDENYANGSIKWTERYIFEVKIIPGTISLDPKDNIKKYVYDVQLKTKINNKNNPAEKL